MVTVSTMPKAACKVMSDQATFTVFPETMPKDQWALMSHPEESTVGKIISWPGEYDVAGMTVRAIGQQDGRQVSFSCQTGGLRIAFIDAPVLDWSDAELEQLGDIDVMIVAASNAKKVGSLVEAVDPRIVILLSNKDAPINDAVKASGGSKAETVDELKLKPGSLPADARQVVVLK